MFQLLPESEGRYLDIKASGWLSEADYDAFEPRLEPWFDQTAPLRVLIDWRDLEGWEKGAKYVGISTTMRTRGIVERMAIITGDRWLDDVVRLTETFGNAQVQRFKPEENDLAWEWLKRE